MEYRLKKMKKIFLQWSTRNEQPLYLSVKKRQYSQISNRGNSMNKGCVDQFPFKAQWTNRSVNQLWTFNCIKRGSSDPSTMWKRHGGIEIENMQWYSEAFNTSAQKIETFGVLTFYFPNYRFTFKIRFGQNPSHVIRLYFARPRQTFEFCNAVRAVDLPRRALRVFKDFSRVLEKRGVWKNQRFNWNQKFHVESSFENE